MGASEIVRACADDMPLEDSRFEASMAIVRVTPVLVPHDCTDGFLYAYWRRPEAYLDPRIRSGSSSFWAIREAEAGLRKLRLDLDTGEWERRFAASLALDPFDAGYRLVVAD